MGHQKKKGGEVPRKTSALKAKGTDKKKLRPQQEKKKGNEHDK